MDFYPIFFTTYALHHNFGSRIFDREELVPVLSLMLAITFHSLLFFVNFWSADINVFFAYRTLSNNDINNCTDIWVKIINTK